MKVLVVSHIPTHPSTEGNRSCIVSYSSLLRRMGHQVEFLLVRMPWVGEREDMRAMRDYWGPDAVHVLEAGLRDRIRFQFQEKAVVRILGRHTLDGLVPSALSRTVSELASDRGFDAVVVNYWMLSGAFELLPGHVRRILFAHDRFADRLGRTGNPWLTTSEATEGKAFDRSHVVLAIQEGEATAFRRCTKTPVLSSFSWFPLDRLPFTGTRNLLYFAGTSADNVQGLRSYCDEILPALLEADPSIRLLVGGGICEVVSDLAGRPGLELQGRVADISDFYRQGDIALNPAFTGTGLKIKTFEAMAHGRAVICHPHSLEGVFKPLECPAVSAASVQEHLRILSTWFGGSGGLDQVCDRSFKYMTELDMEVERVFEAALGKLP